MLGRVSEVLLAVCMRRLLLLRCLHVPVAAAMRTGLAELGLHIRPAMSPYRFCAVAHTL